MEFEFRLPDIGEGVAEGEVVQWFVKEGDAIREDAPLVSVLTDKANVEIPSPKTGRIVKLHAPVGQKVKVGGLLVTFDTAGGGSTAPPSATPRSRPRRGDPASGRGPHALRDPPDRRGPTFDRCPRALRAASGLRRARRRARLALPTPPRGGARDRPCEGPRLRARRSSHGGGSRPGRCGSRSGLFPLSRTGGSGSVGDLCSGALS